MNDELVKAIINNNIDRLLQIVRIQEHRIESLELRVAQLETKPATTSRERPSWLRNQG